MSGGEETLLLREALSRTFNSNGRLETACKRPLHWGPGGSNLSIRIFSPPSCFGAAALPKTQQDKSTRI